MAMDKSNKIGLAVGGSFTAVVTGLLLYLHLGAKPEVPRFAEPIKGKKDIYVCDTAPAWVHKELESAVDFWRKHGAVYGGVVSGVDCDPTCEFRVKGGVRMAPCRDGAIVIDSMEIKDLEDHGGETLWTTENGRLKVATVLIPGDVEPPPKYDEYGVPIMEQYPLNLDALILTHELGHAEGFDHTVTKVVKGVVARKTGEIMNPKVKDLGWGDAGLP